MIDDWGIMVDNLLGFTTKILFFINGVGMLLFLGSGFIGDIPYSLSELLYSWLSISFIELGYEF